MSKRPRTPLTRAIQELGMSPQEFALTRLGLKYSTFSYRVRVGHLTIQDYHRILFFTGKTFEELFPSPYGTQAAPSYLPPSPPPREIVPPVRTGYSLPVELPDFNQGMLEKIGLSLDKEKGAEAPVEFVPIVTGIPSIDPPEEV